MPQKANKVNILYDRHVKQNQFIIVCLSVRAFLGSTIRISGLFLQRRTYNSILALLPFARENAFQDLPYNYNKAITIYVKIRQCISFVTVTVCIITYEVPMNSTRIWFETRTIYFTIFAYGIPYTMQYAVCTISCCN